MLEVQNLLYVFLTKYHGSLNNPSRANGHFREQIFARDCNNSGETEEVLELLSLNKGFRVFPFGHAHVLLLLVWGNPCSIFRKLTTLL